MDWEGYHGYSELTKRIWEIIESHIDTTDTVWHDEACTLLDAINIEVDTDRIERQFQKCPKCNVMVKLQSMGLPKSGVASNRIRNKDKKQIET